MPDEFDFKNYTTMEEFSKTVEGTRYLHEFLIWLNSNRSLLPHSANPPLFLLQASL